MKLYKTYRINQILKLIIFSITLILLFIFSKQNFDNAKNTINIFLFSVLPSLFPFILFTEIILKTDIINILSKIFGNIIYKIFKVNKNSTSSIIIGFLCGYPMGAKATISSLEKNEISHNEASILLNFINNCNPIFILSTISLNIFSNTKIGIILLISHILSAILLGIISSFKYTNKNTLKSKNNNNKNIKSNIYSKNYKISYSNNNNFNQENYTSFFDILKTSILNSFITLELILGFMLIFNIISNIFTIISLKLNLNYNLITIMTGLFEVTGGCFNISNLNIDLKLKICIISFMLGFSGLCIIFQIYSVIYKYKFKITRLILFKSLHRNIFIYNIIYFTINN